MSNFLKIYREVIEPNEGGYANVEGDKGSETYAGISRKFHPTWQGWTFIDYYKNNVGKIKHNQKFKDIQYLVEEFYYNYWKQRNLDLIKFEPLQRLLFDYFVHSDSIAAKALQRIVGVTPDGKIGNQTIQAIEKLGYEKTYNALRKEREIFLMNLVDKTPAYEQFRAGFMKRLSTFPYIAISTGVSTILILLIVIFIIILNLK